MAFTMINNDNYKQEIFGDNDFKLVVFGASWCGPCKMFAPVMQQIAAEYPDLPICANDIDVSTMASDSFGIMSVPTLIAMKNGQEKLRLTGAQTLERVREIIAAYR